jgi:hypothetical protein
LRPGFNNISLPQWLNLASRVEIYILGECAPLRPPIINFTPGPQGITSPPRGEICPIHVGGLPIGRCTYVCTGNLTYIYTYVCTYTEAYNAYIYASSKFLPGAFRYLCLNSPSSNMRYSDKCISTNKAVSNLYYWVLLGDLF